MKKVKFALWIVIVVLLGVVIIENKGFFLAKQGLDVNLFFAEYHTPDLAIAIYFVAIFLVGWLIAYLSGLAERFKSSQQTKKLQQTVRSQQDAIDTMKKDVEALKPRPEPVAETPAPQVETHPQPAEDPEPQDTQV